MDCRNVDKLFDDWLDGELDEGRSAELQRHIDTCDRCANEYATLVSLLATRPQLDPPADLHGRIMTAVEQHSHGGAAAPRARFNWTWPTAAAACLAFFVTGWWASQWSQSPDLKPIRNDGGGGGVIVEQQPIISPWLAMSWARAASSPSPSAPIILMSQAVATEFIASTALEDAAVDWCPPPSLPPLPAEDEPRLPGFPVFVPVQPAMGV